MVKKINADTFVISKITEEMDSIKASISHIEENRKQTTKAIEDKRRDLSDLEQTLYDQDVEIKSHKENRVALHKKLDALKKTAKL